MKDTEIILGASWYPEIWPKEEWPLDISRLKEVGFKLVRLFEFAWKRLEPSEGVYDFDWALDILDQLHAAGIKVMIGTPTAAPPSWLTTKYPEVLKTASDGSRATHGMRKHYNQHSECYRKFSRLITREMARRFGNHPAVHSWQIDNEMSGFDYGEETKAKFHAWLKNRFGTIEALNNKWGLHFWSQAYDDFSQIPLCTANVGSIAVPERHHPSLIMAIARFQNEAWTRFIQDQIEEIQKESKQPITSNMTGFIEQMDWFSHFKKLDRAGISSYADLDHFVFNFVKFERLRSEKDHPFWLLETAPNWSGGGPIWNIHNNEDGIRALTWSSIFAGGSMVLYWQFRSHWAGQEMQHGTCVSQTGKWMPGKQTWTKLADEFSEHGQFLLENPTQRGPVAILADNVNAWVFSIDPIDPENKYSVRVRDDYYLPLLNHHYHRDIIHTSADFSPYSVIVCAHLSILNEDTKSRLRDWVINGGRLLLGPLVGTRTEEMTAWTDDEFGGLESLMGATSSIRFSPHWVEDSIKVRFDDGQYSHPKYWCEGFEPDSGTDVLARYEGGYGDGHPAVLSRKLGSGRIISVGCPLNEDTYIRLIRSLAEEIGISPLLKTGKGILSNPRVSPTGEVIAIGLVNSTRLPVEVEWDYSGTDMLTGDKVGERFTMLPLQVSLIDIS